MSNTCKSKRIVGPYGTWTLEELLGAYVRIASMPISNFTKGFDSDQLCTIKDITFRVTTDGKTITVIELKELPGMIFTWKDIEVVGIVVKQNENDDTEGE